MILQIPNVLSLAQLQEFRQRLSSAEWIDGNATSGAQAAQAKRNRQLPVQAPLTIELGQVILAALAKSPQFIAAAIPKRIVPPLFNCYGAGEHFDFHVDNAIRVLPGTSECLRTDISCTVFISDPADYDGGELIIKDTYGEHSVKLAAGSAVLYPATSLHRVTPITRGTRVCSFFWVQSVVRDDWHRTLLFDLDQTIQHLRADVGDNAQVIALTSHYHNLLRLWTEI